MISVLPSNGPRAGMLGSKCAVVADVTAGAPPYTRNVHRSPPLRGAKLETSNPPETSILRRYAVRLPPKDPYEELPSPASTPVFTHVVV